MIPRHSNPKSERRRARAPYNFVPLPEKVVAAVEPPPQDVYSGVTGWIDCGLETCSPTYVRGMLTEEQFKKHGRKGPDELSDDERAERAPFFAMTENRPVIPGSSLRGMVRSLVEIVGYGKVRWVAAEPKVTFRAVAAARDDPLAEPYRQVLGKFGHSVQAGYLIRRDDGWYVRPAQSPSDLGWPERNAYLKVKAKFIPTGAVPGLLPFNDEEYKPGFHRVSFDVRIGRGRRGPYLAVSDIGTPESGYPYHGTLVWSGNMLETGGGTSPRRNHALILETKKGAPEIKISPQALEDYRDGLTPFQIDFFGRQGCLQQGHPVFYVEEDREVVAFGHSPNFRIPAWLAGTKRAATPCDFAPVHLQDDSLIDLADAMFGWTPEPGGERTTSRAGRVFISDARFLSAKDGIWLSATPITPHVLASPKPTTFQHYLVQDRQQGHDPDDKSSLAHYGTTPSEATIRGHKLYWHKGKVRQSDIAATPKEQEHPKQLTRIMPVKAGVRFKFRVYFENLRSEELGALLWVLQVPGESGKTYRHKIGMGKPLGMGAVAIDKVEVHLTNRRRRYSRLFETHTDRWAEGEEEATGDFVRAFEQFVLQQIAPGKRRLAELERIRALLTMLEWPADQPDEMWTEWTRYLEIEHRENDNEYKDRPVLPTPQEVVRVWREQQTATGGPISPQATLPPGYQCGTVKRYLTERAYGFIQPDEGSEDVFVHQSKLTRGLTTLRPGQRVRFKVHRGPKGLAAEDVSLEKSP